MQQSMLVNGPNISLGEFFTKNYYPYIKSYKKTYSHDWYTFYKNLFPSFGQTNLCDIMSRDVDIWIAKQVSAGYKNSTILKHLVLLKRIMRVAVRWDFINSDIAVNNHRRISIGEPRQRFLNPKEIAQLVYSCYESSHPFLGSVVELLILTGARCGEIRLATWSNIDLDGDRLFVPISKNGKKRTIFLSENAKKIIKTLRFKSEALALPVSLNAFLITNPQTGRPYNDFQAAFKKARDNAGIRDVRIHDLRHTYASLLVQNGVTLYEVQKLLGHSSPNMTQRYAHLNDTSLKQIVNNLPTFL